MLCHMEHDAPRGIVVVDCATHASQMTQYAAIAVRYGAAIAFIIRPFGCISMGRLYIIQI